MKRGWMWMLAAVCVGLGTNARADSPEGGLLNGWGASEARDGQAALGLLSAAGISTNEVGDRLVEWQAKGASPARCAQLLTALAGAAGQAREVLVGQGVAPRPEVVLAGADALVAGASREHLEKAVTGSGSVEGAMSRASALTTLLAQGFAPGASSEAIALAAEHGYREHELVMLATSAGRLAREGVVAREAVLEHVSTALRQGVQARELYPHVQQALHPRSGERTPTPQDGFNHGAVR
jgi:hypothetical protein